MSAPVISELIATSFQGPLEIERMLSPDSTISRITLQAFLFCAITSIRRAYKDAFQIGA
jgi:hypothetical protein